MKPFRTVLHVAVAALAMALMLASPASAQRQPGPGQFSARELVDAGHGFFGGVTAGLAAGIESVIARWGHPTAYILGQEGSGAFAVGLRYGEGTLNTKSGQRLPIFWQGPSLGWDFGGDGSRVMILVYNVNDPRELLRRYVGVTGSAYLVGGLAVTALATDNYVVVPIRSGVGVRLGANLGYLKFTDRPEWNPF
jgi:hypothetical protein